jgi:hypothetical protein
LSSIDQSNVGSISSDISRGATIRTAYVEREVRAYAIFENEVRTISMWNTLSSIFSAISLAFFGIAVGIGTTYAFTDKVTPEGNILFHFAAPACCIITLICAVVAGYAVYSRGAAWRAIRAESKQPKT